MNFLKPLLLFFFIFGSSQVIASDIHFSGFATLAGGLTLDDDESLEGYDDSLGFDSGSLIALQVSKDLGNDWGVTTQFVARGNDAWDLKAEWAYLSYDASDEWRLLFGRQRAPFYLYSDFLDVSYAYHWIKPPGGVYSLPFDVFDGIGSIYTSTLGDFDSTLHAVIGRNSESATFFGIARDSDFSNFFSISWTLNKDWLTLRASYARANLVVPFDELNPLYDGWRSTGAFSNVADGLELDDDEGIFSSLGFIVDYEDYLIVGEMTQVDPGDNLFPEQDSYYLSFGKRFDTVLVHITIGADEDVANFALLNNVPQGVDPGLDFLLASTNGLLLSTEDDSSYYTLGLRWEVTDSVAFKAEYTSYEDKLISSDDASLLQFALTTVF